MNLTASMGTTVASTKRAGRKPTEPKSSKKAAKKAASKPSKARKPKAAAKAPAKARKGATPRQRKPKAAPATPAASMAALLPAPAPAKPAKPAKPATPRAAKPAGKYTIEKNRATENGITRPSVSTKCGAVWAYLDKLAQGTPGSVKLADVKEAAPGQGFNVNNAVIEFYRWRKFNGLRGRQ